MKSAFGFGLALAAAMVALPASAEAESYTFSSCLEDNSGLCTSLAPQLKIEVTEGSGYVDFTVTNDIGIQSSITDLYFDATGFLTGMTIESESSGVNFTEGSADPPNVPGAGSATPPFVVSSGLLADSDPPAMSNGINSAGEYLMLRFEIAEGKTFADIIEALNVGPNTDQGIRIAAHVQGVGPESQSDSLLCCSGAAFSAATPSPEPASMSLFALAALGAAYRLRRRRAIQSAC